MTLAPEKCRPQVYTEASIKFPAAKGSSGSFWMTGGRPLEEIDIVESHYSKSGRNSASFNLHLFKKGKQFTAAKPNMPAERKVRSYDFCEHACSFCFERFRTWRLVGGLL